MVGSRDSVASPNVVLNTIVAEAFAEACDVLDEAEDFEMAVHDLIKKYATEHQRIIFNGNGYSDEWVEEAERRGLPNIRSMVEAIPALTTEKTVEMFERFHVLTRAELESRAEIRYENYSKAINIEARTMIDMASKQFGPGLCQIHQIPGGYGERSPGGRRGHHRPDGDPERSDKASGRDQGSACGPLQGYGRSYGETRRRRAGEVLLL